VWILRCLKSRYLLFFPAHRVFRYAGMDVTSAKKLSFLFYIPSWVTSMVYARICFASPRCSLLSFLFALLLCMTSRLLRSYHMLHTPPANRTPVSNPIPQQPCMGNLCTNTILRLPHAIFIPSILQFRRRIRHIDLLILITE
jgi:hypothetical protein